MIGLSAVLGPVLGGALVDLDILGAGWRTIFLINVPLGSAALVGAARLLPSRAPSGRPRSTSSAPRWSASALGC